MKTVTNLIDRVRLAADIHSNDTDFTDAIVEGFISEAQDDIADSMVSFDANYYTGSLDVTCDGSALYPLPDDSNGHVLSFTYLPTNSSSEVMLQVERALDNPLITSGEPFSVIVEGGTFRLNPKPSSGTVRIRYQRRPLEVDASVTYYTVTAKTSSTVTLSDGGTGLASATYSMLRSAEPHNQADDLVLGAASGSGVYALTSGSPLVGDYVFSGSLSPIVQHSRNGYKALLYRTTVLILTTTGEKGQADVYHAMFNASLRRLEAEAKRRIHSHPERLPDGNLITRVFFNG